MNYNFQHLVRNRFHASSSKSYRDFWVTSFLLQSTFSILVCICKTELHFERQLLGSNSRFVIHERYWKEGNAFSKISSKCNIVNASNKIKFACKDCPSRHVKNRAFWQIRTLLLLTALYIFSKISWLLKEETLFSSKYFPVLSSHSRSSKSLLLYILQEAPASFEIYNAVPPSMHNFFFAAKLYRIYSIHVR